MEKRPQDNERKAKEFLDEELAREWPDLDLSLIHI